MINGPTLPTAPGRNAGGDSRALELVFSVGVEDLPTAVVAIEMFVPMFKRVGIHRGKPVTAVGSLVHEALEAYVDNGEMASHAAIGL